jgi:hypothetical protein
MAQRTSWITGSDTTAEDNSPMNGTAAAVKDPVQAA